MNRGTSLLAAGSILLIMAGQANTGLAAETFKVGVINQRAVMERTKAGQRALQELKEFTANQQRILAAEDEDMKQLERELKEQEAKLSEAAKRAKQEQFRAKLEQYQRQLQELNRDIQLKQQEMADRFLRKIDEATSAVAKKAGYGAVLDIGNESTLRIVLYHHQAIDLTDRVVKEFDRRNR